MRDIVLDNGVLLFGIWLYIRILETNSAQAQQSKRLQVNNKYIRVETLNMENGQENKVASFILNIVSNFYLGCRYLI